MSSGFRAVCTCTLSLLRQCTCNSEEFPKSQLQQIWQNNILWIVRVIGWSVRALPLAVAAPAQCSPRKSLSSLDTLWLLLPTVPIYSLWFMCICPMHTLPVISSTTSTKLLFEIIDCGDRGGCSPAELALGACPLQCGPPIRRGATSG
jgi:hypothetical protein